MMEYLRDAFGMEYVDLRTYSPLTLAYIGDAIYDLIIRTLIVKQGNSRPEKMHKRASALVKASAQAEMIERLLPMLTEEEHAIYKRGQIGRASCRERV